MRHITAYVLAASACLCSSALADPTHPQSLPGVEGGHSIVEPLPEPDNLPMNEDGSIQIGNTRVKISGSVTVDIGAGAVKEPHK